MLVTPCRICATVEESVKHFTMGLLHQRVLHFFKKKTDDIIEARKVAVKLNLSIKLFTAK